MFFGGVNPAHNDPEFNPEVVNPVGPPPQTFVRARNVCCSPRLFSPNSGYRQRVCIYAYRGTG